MTGRAATATAAMALLAAAACGGRVQVSECFVGCPPGAECGPDGENCVPRACALDADCGGAYPFCTAGACGTRECSRDEECEETSACFVDVCVVGDCASDAECAFPFVCQSGYCSPSYVREVVPAAGVPGEPGLGELGLAFSESAVEGDVGEIVFRGYDGATIREPVAGMAWGIVPVAFRNELIVEGGRVFQLDLPASTLTPVTELAGGYPRFDPPVLVQFYRYLDANFMDRGGFVYYVLTEDAQPASSAGAGPDVKEADAAPGHVCYQVFGEAAVWIIDVASGLEWSIAVGKDDENLAGCTDKGIYTLRTTWTLDMSRDPWIVWGPLQFLHYTFDGTLVWLREDSGPSTSGRTEPAGVGDRFWVYLPDRVDASSQQVWVMDLESGTTFPLAIRPTRYRRPVTWGDHVAWNEGEVDSSQGWKPEIVHVTFAPAL